VQVAYLDDEVVVAFDLGAGQLAQLKATHRPSHGCVRRHELDIRCSGSNHRNRGAITLTLTQTIRLHGDRTMPFGDQALPERPEFSCPIAQS